MATTDYWFWISWLENAFHFEGYVKGDDLNYWGR